MTAAEATPTKAVGYVRVSTESQAAEGISLAAQRDPIEGWSSCPRALDATSIPPEAHSWHRA
jgi:hypothetical protein